MMNLPLFGSSKMKIIYRVKIHIFGMPRKRCFPHTEVEICRVHTFDFRSTFCLKIIENSSETIHIPNGLILVVETSTDI